MIRPITFPVKVDVTDEKQQPYIVGSFSEIMAFVRQYCGVNTKNNSSQTLDFWSVRGLFLFLKNSVQSLQKGCGQNVETFKFKSQQNEEKVQL